MVSGRLPFEGDRVEAVIYRFVNEDPRPLTALRTGVPMALDRIVAKALAKRPDERYQNVTDMLVDIRAVHREAAAFATPTSCAAMCSSSGSRG